MARKPLEGIRVVDLAWVWSGPYCCMLLAHLGADVIKVESSLRLCMTRSTPPWPDGKPLPPTSGGGIFSSNNLGKRSVTFNLKTPGGLEATRRLISTSDVVVNNYAAGVMERLGLSYDDLKKIKPDIILISLSGYGETGPYRNYVAYGQAQAALSGFTRLTGHRCRDMEQKHRVVKLDMWVSIAVANEDQWARLCTAMGKPELASDPRFATLELRKRHEDALEEIIKAWTRPRTPYEVTRILQAAGVPAFTCNTYKDVFEDANLNQRGFFVEINHPTFGVRTHPGVPWRMSNVPADIKSPSPLLGQDTEEVLKELGYSDGAIEDLQQSGALT